MDDDILAATALEASGALPEDVNYAIKSSFLLSFLESAPGTVANLKAVVVMLAGVRFLVWRRVQHEMAVLKNKQALESERLRIAQDIHDDLGSRVTQISLVSAMFLNDLALSTQARSGFQQIKQMSQDLVSSLYETVWAVNPEYDNLAALGDYLCQMVNQLCDKTDLRVRLQVQDLPQEIQVPSHFRHHIIMIAKEAVHNVIKHAGATEVVLHMTFRDTLLEFSIQDNGCGFLPHKSQSGSGLANIKRRVTALGGTCSTESDHGHGTIVRVQIHIKNPDHE